MNGVELVPIDIEKVVDGIVVYPRLARVREAYPLNLTPENALKIMKIKQLAEKGLIPTDANKDYCARCRYREKCKFTPENKLVDPEAATLLIPLPIIATIELTEKLDFNLDALFNGVYFERLYNKVFRGFVREGIDIRHIPSINEKAKFLEKLTSIPYSDILEALKHYYEFKHLIVNDEEIENKLHETLGSAQEIVQGKNEALKLTRDALYNIPYECAYPSNSTKRVKEAYRILNENS